MKVLNRLEYFVEIPFFFHDGQFDFSGMLYIMYDVRKSNMTRPMVLQCQAPFSIFPFILTMPKFRKCAVSYVQ